jgi:hypothetical protein
LWQLSCSNVEESGEFFPCAIDSSGADEKFPRRGLMEEADGEAIYFQVISAFRRSDSCLIFLPGSIAGLINREELWKMRELNSR